MIKTKTLWINVTCHVMLSQSHVLPMRTCSPRRGTHRPTRCSGQNELARADALMQENVSQTRQLLTAPHSCLPPPNYLTQIMAIVPEPFSAATPASLNPFSIWPWSDYWRQVWQRYRRTSCCIFHVRVLSVWSLSPVFSVILCQHPRCF